MSTIEQLHCDILTDLINGTNIHNPNFAAYAYGDLKFRRVRAVLNEERYDTTAEFSSLEEPEDHQWRPLYYRRVSITHFIREPDIGILYDPSYQSIYDLLPAINAAHEVQFTEQDLQNTPLNLPSTEDHPFGPDCPMTYKVPLHASPNALIVRGSTYITLTL
jgi:hypothetical protein